MAAPGHPDQAVGEDLALQLASIGYAHLKVAADHEAVTEMSAEELGSWLS
jgi:hypothetical protein